MNTGSKISSRSYSWLKAWGLIWFWTQPHLFSASQFPVLLICVVDNWLQSSNHCGEVLDCWSFKRKICHFHFLICRFLPKSFCNVIETFPTKPLQFQYFNFSSQSSFYPCFFITRFERQPEFYEHRQSNIKEWRQLRSRFNQL